MIDCRYMTRAKGTKSLWRNVLIILTFNQFANVRYIFASLFLSLKRALVKLGKYFLFHFKSSFRCRENQIYKFCIFKFHEVIKYKTIKEEIRFTE